MKGNIALIIISLGMTSYLQAVETNTGKTIFGPPVMEHPTYPNSGQLRHRSIDITGEEMSNSTMSSDQDPRVPSENPQVKKTSKHKQQIPQGPYDDEYRIHQEEGLDGKEAQEAAETKKFDLSNKEIKRKQQGH